MLPLDQRILAVCSAVCRVEACAWFRTLLPWLTPRLHPKVYGGIAGHDSNDASWELQAQIEEALLDGMDLTVLAVDYVKYFDSFDHDWTRDFMLHLKLLPHYVHMMHNLYKNSNAPSSSEEQ